MLSAVDHRLFIDGNETSRRPVQILDQDNHRGDDHSHNTFIREIIGVKGLKNTQNYGANRIRYLSPVPAGSRLRPCRHHGGRGCAARHAARHLEHRPQGGYAASLAS